MKEAIKFMADIVNLFHDILMKLSNTLGLELTDKELHFWVIGLIGFFIFIFVDKIFRALSKCSITTVSFLYTFTVLIVFVFAIEIQQKITGKGNMEFADVIMGLYGFIFFFIGYLILKLVMKVTVKFLSKSKGVKNHLDKKINL